MEHLEESKAPVSSNKKISRRKLFLGGGLVGGALCVGYLGINYAKVLSLGAKEGGSSAFGAFIKIDPEGWVTVFNKHQEMGQGSHAGLAAIVAEELDADWEKVRVEHAPANFALYKGGLGMQGTGGSTAIATSWDQLRNAGAAARGMFVAAAAARWKVPAEEIKVSAGNVTHEQSARQASFAELLDEASRIKPQSKPSLKDPKAFTLIGSSRVGRKDSAAKSHGTTRYTQDVQMDGLLVAVVAHPPLFGAVVKKFNSDAAKDVRGVVDVVQIPTGIAVLAKTTFAAMKGRDALEVEWDESEAEKRSTADLEKHFRDLVLGATKDSPNGDEILKKGEVQKEFESEALEMEYDFPYLAHAAMEPMNCVTQIDGRRVKLTSASQIQTLDQINVARTVFTLPGMVEIETLPAGGSFGRRGVFSSDYVRESVMIAQQVKKNVPVKLVWSREDDTSAGYYRPASYHKIWVRTDEKGLPKAWRTLSAAPNIMPFGANKSAVEGIAESPLVKHADVIDVRVFTAKTAIPVSFWRSVGHSHMGMVLEHSMDQLARRANRDPAEYRRAIYTQANDARRLAVLDLLLEKSGYGKMIDEGWAQGLAIHESFGSVVGQVAEVQIVEGVPRVRRVVCVVDCGIAVSPNQIEAQMEGGVCFGLSAALFGAITLKEGRVEQRNFDSYRVLRMDEAPIVETHIVPSAAHPGGIGETAVPPIAPAVANAILALTGKATTRLPFVSQTI